MQNIPIISQVPAKEGVSSIVLYQRITNRDQYRSPFGKLRFIIVLFLIATFQMACTPSVEESTEETEKSEITAPAETPGKQIVEIKGMKFNPATIRSSIGDTVLFVNKDLVPHNVTDRENQDTLSSQIDPTAEWMLIVTKNLHFYCSLHPTMEGEVQVANL